jgi:PAS domain-containing protein
VLDSLDVAVVVLDETSRVLAGNVAASRLLGIRRGRRASDVPDPAPLSVTDEAGASVDVLDYDSWRSRSRAPMLLRVAAGDGSVRWLSATTYPLGGPVDEPDAVVCRYTDVTRSRELERRAATAADLAARAEIDLVAAEQRVALLEELLVYLATKTDRPA